MPAGARQGDDALRMVAPEDRGGMTIVEGGPAGHPGVADDQQAGRLGLDAHDDAVGVVRGPLGRREGLANSRRPEGVAGHQHGRAGVDVPEGREDRGRVVGRDDRPGDDIGAGHRGGVAMDREGVPAPPPRRQERPGGVGIDVVGDQEGHAHPIEHPLLHLAPVSRDGFAQRLRTGRRAGAVA